MNDWVKDRLEKLEFAILVVMVAAFIGLLVELANGN